MLSLEQQNALREQYRRQRPGWRPATEVYAALVRAHLAPQARVLDLGCGRGGLVEQLDHPLTLLAGVDPDLASLAAHRLPLLPRAAAFSEALPFADGRFHVVFASWLLEHLPRPLATLREIRRVLRPGGAFIFITPNARHPLAQLNRGFGRLGVWQQWLVARLYGRAGADTFPTAYRANTAADLRALSGRSGFHVHALHALPDPTYLAFTPSLFRLACALEARLAADRHIHLVGVLRAGD